MPTIVCPTCATKLEIDDDMIGEDVQCGSCQQIFKAEDESKRKKSSRAGRDDDDEKPRKSKYRKDEDDDDEDERPSRRRSSKRDDDDDDDDDDEEDYEDRRSRRRRGSQQDSNGMGIAALVCGIIGVLGSCCCLFVIPSVLGIIFGVISLKTSGKNLGIAGIILGCLGLLLTIGWRIFGIALNAGGGGGPGGW